MAGRGLLVPPLGKGDSDPTSRALRWPSPCQELDSLTPGHCVLNTFPWKKSSKGKNNDGQKSPHRGPSALPGSCGADLLVTLTVCPISLNGSARLENPPAPGQGRHVLSPLSRHERDLTDSRTPFHLCEMKCREVRKRGGMRKMERERKEGDGRGGVVV